MVKNDEEIKGRKFTGSAPAPGATVTMEVPMKGLQGELVMATIRLPLQGDPDRRAPPAARGAGQARRVRGHQGRHQVHQLQIRAGLCKSFRILANDPFTPV